MSDQGFPIAPTAYQVLGVAHAASQAELKAAWRRAARAAHPDYGGDPGQFQQVSAAWELVADPQARAHYDSRLARELRTPPSSSASSHSPSARASRPRTATPPATRYHPPLSEGPLTVQVGKQSVVVDAELSARTHHGAPVAGGMFSSRRRTRLIAHTDELLRRMVLTGLPAARLFTGVKIRHSRLSSVSVDHVVLCGSRAAVVTSVEVPPDAYQWHGDRLVSGGKSIPLPDLAPAVSAVSKLLPDHQTRGFVVAFSTDENPHAPLVSPAPGFTTDPRDILGDAPASSMQAARAIKMFLGLGENTHVVNREQIGVLLATTMVR